MFSDSCIFKYNLMQVSLWSFADIVIVNRLTQYMFVAVLKLISDVREP